MKHLIAATLAATAAISTGAKAQDCDPSTTTEVGVIEVVQFRLAENIDREDFLSAAANTMPALCTTQGFIGRVLSEGEDGTWLDHVKWTNLQAAQAWTAPIEWSGVNVSAWSASGLSARCFRVLAGDTQGSYAV